MVLLDECAHDAHGKALDRAGTSVSAGLRIAGSRHSFAARKSKSKSSIKSKWSKLRILWTTGLSASLSAALGLLSTKPDSQLPRRVVLPPAACQRSLLERHAQLVLSAAAASLRLIAALSANAGRIAPRCRPIASFCPHLTHLTRPPSISSPLQRPRESLPRPRANRISSAATLPWALQACLTSALHRLAQESPGSNL